MTKWLKQHARFWVRTFWGTVLIGVIALAVTVQMGRAVFPIMNEYRGSVERALSDRLGVDIAIGGIAGEWQGLRPKLALADLSVRNPETGEAVFTVSTVEVEVGLLSSILDWRLAFRQVSFDGLQVTLMQEDEGRWLVRGLPETEAAALEAVDPAQQPLIDDPLDIFLFGRRVNLQDTKLRFVFRNDLQADITIPRIRMENDVDFHRLNAELRVGERAQAMALVVEGRGDPRDEQNFDANGYLSLRDFPSEQVLAALGITADALIDESDAVVPQWQHDGRVDLNLWFNGTAEKGFRWSGDVAVEGVPLIPPEGVQWPRLFSSTFYGEWDSRAGWEVALRDTELSWDDFAAPAFTALFRGGRGDPSELRVDRLDLNAWHDVFTRAGWLPEPLTGIFNELRPYGELNRVAMQARAPEDGYFFLRANVRNGGVHPWSGVPAVDGVNGYLETTALDGHIMLNSQDGFTLNFPKVYHHPLAFERADGDLRWKVNLEEQRVGISSGEFRVAREDVSAKGYLNLRLPFHPEPGVEPEMTLVIGVEEGFADLHRMLVPYTVPEDLYSWLDSSILEGSLHEGAFIYHGTLMSESKLHRVLQLSVRARDAVIQFDPRWPRLSSADGRLLLDDQRFSVTRLKAEMLGVSIEQGSIALRQSARGASPAIALQGRIRGTSQDILQLLKTSPVRSVMGEELANWKLQGGLAGAVDLLVPLGSDKGGEQHIRLQLEDNGLYIPTLDLSFTGLNGDFNYSSQTGLQVALRGSLWGNAMQFSMDTLEPNTDGARLQGRFSGAVDLAPLTAWMNRPEMGFFSGSAQVSGRLLVPLGSDEPIAMDLHSDLLGVAIDLPHPVGKTTDSPTPFHMRLELDTSDRETRYRFDLQNRVGVKAQLVRRSDAMQAASIVFGDEEPKLESGFVNVSGRLVSGDAIQWYDALLRYMNALDAQPVALVNDERFTLRKDPFRIYHHTPVRARLHFDRLHATALEFRDVSLEALELAESWQINLAGPDIAGTVEYFGEQRPLRVDLDHLTLTTSEVGDQHPEDVDTSATGEVSGMSALDPASLPAAEVQLSDWYIGKQPMGQLSFRLRPSDSGAVVFDLHAQVRGLHIQGPDERGAELIWLNTDRGHVTHFSGVATAGDVGEVLQAWEMEKALTSKTAAFDFSLQWLGAPDDMTLLSLAGLVEVDIERGRFIRGASAGENPLVKLVGLLNFDTLARRLRLDFSDLHPEGMGYEQVTGELVFHRGTISIESPLKVSMPASELQLVGTVDMVGERLDGQLVATLPLAGNLTFAAALTGGLPSAVMVFVVSKLFKRQMDMASSLRYRIRGAWDDPELKLEKVFESSTEPRALTD